MGMADLHGGIPSQKDYADKPAAWIPRAALPILGAGMVMSMAPRC
jgi:hypothetical protein